MDVPEKLLAQDSSLNMNSEHKLGLLSLANHSNAIHSDSVDPALLQQKQQKQLVTEQVRHISLLEQQLYTLQTDLQLKQSKISVLEQQQHLANQRINELTQSIEILHAQGSQSDEQFELEAQITNNNVLKHHCTRLADQNYELETALKESQILLENTRETAQKQASMLFDVQNSHTEQLTTIAEQNLTILRQEKDLKNVSSNYYDGIINTEKRLSTNLPD